MSREGKWKEVLSKTVTEKISSNTLGTLTPKRL